jgi:hypothetical protein
MRRGRFRSSLIKPEPLEEENIQSLNAISGQGQAGQNEEEMGANETERNTVENIDQPPLAIEFDKKKTPPVPGKQRGKKKNRSENRARNG